MSERINSAELSVWDCLLLTKSGHNSENARRDPTKNTLNSVTNSDSMGSTIE